MAAVFPGDGRLFFRKTWDLEFLPTIDPVVVVDTVERCKVIEIDFITGGDDRKRFARPHNMRRFPRALREGRARKA